jgi:UDP-N-acetylglucosamine 2-epimerase
VIVGNSSAGIREASFLGIPAVDIGDRQLGRERAENVVNVAHDTVAIREAVEAQLARGRYPSSTLYGDGRAGERIARVLAEAELTFEKRLDY